MKRSPRLRAWTLGCLTLAVVGAVYVVIERRQRLGPVSRLAPSAVTIVPGVHLLGALEPSAAYVVETPDGLVLIDTGLERDAGLVKSQIQSLGLGWKRLRAILLTHTHGDHCGGAEHLRSETGAKVYAGHGDASVLRAGAPRVAFFSTFYMPGHAPHPTTVDVELVGGEVVTVGGVRFQALATPGHTPGSVCYLMERDGVRALFAGDVVTMLRGDGNPHPLGLKPLGTYSAYLPPRYRGDARSYLASLRALRSLATPDLVLPGHPRSDPTPQSPALTERRWHAILDEGIRDMQTLVARYETDGADFLDREPKHLLADLDYFGDFQGSAVYGLFAGPKFFLIDAPGGPGLFDFVTDRLRRLGRPAAAPTAVLLTSCRADATAGLKELLEKCRPDVVTSPAGLTVIKASCPPGTVVVSTTDLPGKGWFGVKTFALRGRGPAPAAYLFTVDGKRVLASGRIPTLFDHASMESLFADLAGSRDDAAEFLSSVNELAGVNPDLWLPAVPSDGQNANLYDGDWAYAVANSYRAGHFSLRSPR